MTLLSVLEFGRDTPAWVGLGVGVAEIAAGTCGLIWVFGWPG